MNAVAMPSWMECSVASQVRLRWSRWTPAGRYLQKPLRPTKKSMTYPNSFHTSFAFVSTETAVLYFSDDSEVSWAPQAQKAPIFSLTTLFTVGVAINRHWRPSHNSVTESSNIADSDSIPPNSLGSPNSFRGGSWKTLLSEASARCLQFTLTAHLGLLALSDRFPGRLM